MKKRLEQLRKSKFAGRISRATRAIQISKKNEISLYDVGFFFFQQLRQNDLNSEAKSVAFSFTLAIFPAIIFFFTLIPYLNLPWLTEDSIVGFLRDGLQLPENMYESISKTILDIAGKERGGLLSFGFISALFLSTNGMIALMDAFNKCYRSIEKRSFLMKRLIAMGLTGILAAVLALSIIVLVFGSSILKLIHDYEFIPTGLYEFIKNLRVIEYGVFFLLFFLAISVIYYFAPAVQKRWRFFSYGAFIATVLSVLVSAIFSFYVNNFGTYNKLYGSIGTLIGFLIWLNFITLMILVGFEVNAAIDLAKIEAMEKRAQNGEPLDVDDAASLQPPGLK